MKFSDIMRQVISMARAANQARTAEGPEDDSPIVTSGGDVSTMRLRNAEERRLGEFLEAQSPLVVYMLTAIIHLGRGDFTVNELLDQYVEVTETFGNPKWAVRQMLGKALLPDYLEEGLKKLAHAGVDPDALPTT